jgi:hypothetical protein
MQGSKVKLNLVLMSILLLLIAVYFVYTATSNPFAKAEDYLPSRTFEVTANEPEPRIVQIRPFDRILEKIEEGKRVLAESPSLKFDGARKEIAIAILDTKTGKVLERRYWISDSDMSQANETRAHICGQEDHFPRLNSVVLESDLSIIVNWWNGYNSNLSVTDGICSEEDRYIVIGNKVLVSNERLAYPQEKTGKKYSDIIYIPYSEQLHRQEIVKEGLEFLNSKVTSAYADLRILKVKSRSMPDRLAAEAVTPVFLKNLFVNEHSDPSLMMKARDGGRLVAERVLVRLGLNKEKAFRYTYSSAGAFGLGQIMPATYKSIVHEYPEALLMKDTGIGRADVLNSIKASILVLDDHFASVVRKANQTSGGKDILHRKSEQEIEDIMAAIYNGGPGKYQSLTGNISMAITETIGYLVKIGLIRELHLFDQ